MMSENNWKLLAGKQRTTITRLQKRLTAMTKLNHALADLQPAPEQPASRMRVLRRAVAGCLALDLRAELPLALRCLPDPPVRPSEAETATKNAAVAAARASLPAGSANRRARLVNAARLALGRRSLDIVPAVGKWTDYV